MHSNMDSEPLEVNEIYERIYEECCKIGLALESKELFIWRARCRLIEARYLAKRDENIPNPLAGIKGFRSFRSFDSFDSPKRQNKRRQTGFNSCNVNE